MTGLLLVNIIPLGVLAWAVILYLRGELPLDQLPGGIGAHLAMLVAIALFFVVVARFTLPAVHEVVKAIERGLKIRQAVATGKLEGNRAAAVLLIPFLGLAWAAVYPVRFLLMIAALVLLLLIAVGLVRLFQPEFLVDVLPDLMIRPGR